MTNIKAKWLDNAQLYDGVMPIWINQGSNQVLAQANSNGVCFALTRAWVTANRTSTVERSRFIDSFEGPNQAATAEAPSFIPAAYLGQQQDYAAKLEEHRKTLQLMLEQLEKLKTEKPLDQSKLTDISSALLAMRKETYGPSFKELNSCPAEQVTLISQLLEAMEENADGKAAYFMLVLRKPGGGHVFGFGYRPDLAMNDLFPKVYEFIDANLGLFVFPSVEKMHEFFEFCVWPGAYESYGTKFFDLIEFEAPVVTPVIVPAPTPPVPTPPAPPTPPGPPALPTPPPAPPSAPASV